MIVENGELVKNLMQSLTRYKWGYKSYHKSKHFVGEHGGKVYLVRFSNLESPVEFGITPTLHTGWTEFDVWIETNTPKKLLRRACAEFRTENELREFVGAINQTVALR